MHLCTSSSMLQDFLLMVLLLVLNLNGVRRPGQEHLLVLLQSRDSIPQRASQTTVKDCFVHTI